MHEGVMEAREVARFARKKARQLAAAAANMGLPDDRARLIGYAKVLEEEAVKLEHGGSGGRSSDGRAAAVYNIAARF